jgi:hypothetical protein
MPRNFGDFSCHAATPTALRGLQAREFFDEAYGNTEPRKIESCHHAGRSCSHISTLPSELVFLSVLLVSGLLIISA